MLKTYKTKVNDLTSASDSTGRLFNLGEMSCFNQHNAQFNEFEYHFACRRKDVHLCFITSPGKMIFAVLEL